MTISQVEAAILERLRSITATASTELAPNPISGFKVEALPKGYENYQLTNASGAILVQYSGAKYNAPTNLGDAAVIRQMAFTIYTVDRNLSGQQSAYNTIEAVLLALTNWTPERTVDGTITGRATAPMYPSNERYIDSAGGIWVYAMQFSVQVLYFPNQPPEQVFGALTELTITSEHEA